MWLVGLAATAQTAPVGHSAPRSVVLTGKAGEAPLIFLAPGIVTVLLLDAPLVREAVELEGRARFSVVDVGERTVTLSPAVALGPAERLALRVTYREGIPSSAVFLLTGQPGQRDEVVNVLRPQQSGEACRVELAALRGQCEAQRQELEALKARPAALSPAAFMLAGGMDGSGIQGKDLNDACSKVRGTLHLQGCEVLGAATWSLMVFEVSNTADEPWSPAWAEVIPVAGGAPRRARAVLSGQPILSSGASTRVAVELEMPMRKSEARLTEPHTLRVCNGDGSRCLSIPNVKL
ncbi:hypothetical protein DB31_0253 [Hyalangium minutum]|uniref:Uncharacterized protein n=1 Tax=Hyalangium minutum TaxID=394096 RepID=A0A085WWC9_9BACT|nr:hypothetical protein DB31_0253 [Hyalangium minutum]